MIVTLSLKKGTYQIPTLEFIATNHPVAINTLNRTSVQDQIEHDRALDHQKAHTELYTITIQYLNALLLHFDL